MSERQPPWVDALRRRIWESRVGGRLDVDTARRALEFMKSMGLRDLVVPDVHIGMISGYIAMTWVSDRRKLEIVFRKNGDVEYEFKTKGVGSDSYSSRGCTGAGDVERVAEIIDIWSVKSVDNDPRMDRVGQASL